MKLDTKAIRARADACFRAPWTASPFAVRCDIVEHADSGFEDCDGEHDIERIESPEEYPDGQVVADVPGMEMFSKPHAVFIAAARTDVPALCDRVEALEAALRRIVDESLNLTAIGIARRVLEEP
jgi:hypothetical protein